MQNGDKSTEIQPLVENTEATTKSKPEALPVSKTSNGNTKQHANRSGPQKTVKMTNSDNNNKSLFYNENVRTNIFQIHSTM